MIKEKYVNFEIAKLLKEKGFKEWCRCCYGTAVLHNGKDISFYEECDLKDEGRGNEIEYVEGGAFHYLNCNNGDEDTNVWAAPTIQTVVDWLLEAHHYYIQVMLDSWAYNGRLGYYGLIIKTDSNFDLMLQDVCDKVFYDKPEDVYIDAIKYILENLI